MCELLPNAKRQPREAAASGARMQTERNGCLPLAARSGWGSSLFCSDRNGLDSTRRQRRVPVDRPDPINPGLAEHDLPAVWIRADTLQCGYVKPGGAR